MSEPLSYRSIRDSSIRIKLAGRSAPCGRSCHGNIAAGHSSNLFSLGDYKRARTMCGVRTEIMPKNFLASREQARQTAGNVRCGLLQSTTDSCKRLGRDRHEVSLSTFRVIGKLAMASVRSIHTRGDVVYQNESCTVVHCIRLCQSKLNVSI